LEGKLAAEQDKSRGLERERDELKLGSIDRQRIDDKLSDWHCELTKTINWIVGLKNLDADVLYDIFSALKWTMHRCDVATLHLIEHSPALKIYGDLSDRMNTVLYRLDGMETRNFNVPEPTPETIEIMRTAGYLDAEVDGPASGEACAED
jgi:hypothetical protein